MDMIGLVEGSFEWALMYLKHGSRIRRKGWENKEAFLYLTTGLKVPTDDLRTDTSYNLFGNNKSNDIKTVKINSHIDMRISADNILIGWSPDQIDMITNDWEILK